MLLFFALCGIINLDNGILVPNDSNSSEAFSMTDTNSSKRIILASASPRRKDILGSMGAQFEILVADADESSDITDPELLTRELARRKANAALEILRSRGEADGAIIIAADTVVACESKILGKPRVTELGIGNSLVNVESLFYHTEKLVVGKLRIFLGLNDF